jgi:hypothetical protein
MRLTKVLCLKEIYTRTNGGNEKIAYTLHVKLLCLLSEVEVHRHAARVRKIPKAQKILFRKRNGFSRDHILSERGL